MSDRPTYIYALCEPGTEVAAGEIPPPIAIRYVGVTVNPKNRLSQHLHNKTDDYRGRWVRSVLARGLQPVMCIVEATTDALRQERERWWIRHYRDLGARLTNSTDGGEGQLNAAPETRRKHAEWARRQWEDTEYRARQSAISRETMLKLRADPDFLARYYRGVSEGLKAAWADPEKRAARIEGIKAAAARLGAAERVRRLERARAAWANPETSAVGRTKVSEAKRQEWANPEKRAARAAGIKKSWTEADPELRAARISKLQAGYKASVERKRLKRLAAEVKEQLKLPLD